MTTDLLEKPDLDDQDTDEDKVIHRVCGRCWKLPGDVLTLCGIFLERCPDMTGQPGKRCEKCLEADKQRTHQCLV